MIGMIMCIFATLLNLGVVIYCKKNYDRDMKEWRDLGRMEGYIEGVKSASKGEIKFVRSNFVTLN